MNRNQFYYADMSGSFIDCDVEIKTENHPINLSDSPLFPLTSLQYENYNFAFSLSSIRNAGLKPLDAKLPHKNESLAQIKQREENRERMRRFRLSLSEVEKQIKREQNAQHMREFRKNLPEIEKQIRRQKAAEYMREFRRNLSEVERQIRRKIDTERMRKFRSNLSEIDKEIRRQKGKERMRRQREEMRMRNLEKVNAENYTV